MFRAVRRRFLFSFLHFLIEKMFVNLIIVYVDLRIIIITVLLEFVIGKKILRRETGEGCSNNNNNMI